MAGLLIQLVLLLAVLLVAAVKDEYLVVGLTVVLVFTRLRRIDELRRGVPRRRILPRRRR